MVDDSRGDGRGRFLSFMYFFLVHFLRHFKEER